MILNARFWTLDSIFLRSGLLSQPPDTGTYRVAVCPRAVKRTPLHWWGLCSSRPSRWESSWRRQVEISAERWRCCRRQGQQRGLNDWLQDGLHLSRWDSSVFGAIHNLQRFKFPKKIFESAVIQTQDSCWGGGGSHSTTMVSVLASYPAAPGSILGVPNIFQITNFQKFRSRISWCCGDLSTAVHCLVWVDSASNA